MSWISYLTGTCITYSSKNKTLESGELRPRPYFAGEIWKRSFISTTLVLDIFLDFFPHHESRERAAKRRTRVALSRLSHAEKNQDKPLGSGYISTIRPFVLSNLSRKQNVLQTGGIWKRWLCVLLWTEIILKTELSENDKVTIIMWFPALPEFSSNTNPEWPVIVACSIFPPRGVDAKYLMRF